MSETIELEVELARELAYSDAGDTIDGYTVMLNEQIDTRRWESVHRLVIRDDETKKFYFDTYRLGLTESQDTRAYEYEKEANFHEVFAAPKVTTVTDYVSADKVPEPDPCDPRQIAIDLIHKYAVHQPLVLARMAVIDRHDLKSLGKEGLRALVAEVREHINRATVTVEIPDEVTE